MILRELGWGGMGWIDLAQDWGQWRALVNMVMNLRVRQNVSKFLCRCTTSSFSRRAQLQEVSQSINVFYLFTYLLLVSCYTVSITSFTVFTTLLMLILVYLMASIHVQFTLRHFLYLLRFI
jgi:hypothetical protein